MNIQWISQKHIFEKNRILATMKPTWAWAAAHFLSPPYTLYPQTGVFLEGLVSALSIKKNGTREFEVKAHQ